jgi:protein-tyrosine phosphatase
MMRSEIFWVHCRQGIGRSGLIAAGLLIESGLDSDGAIRRVSQARQVPIPETVRQKRWIDSFAAAIGQKR